MPAFAGTSSTPSNMWYQLLQTLFQEAIEMMRIGTRISPDWLDRPEDLRFLTQIGVDAVDITMDMVPGYLESGGAASRDGMKMVVDKLADVGLVIERANCLSSQFHDAYLGGTQCRARNPQRLHKRRTMRRVRHPRSRCSAIHE